MKFLARRLVAYLITAWAAITLNFFLPRWIPGDPVSALLTKFQGRMSAETVDALKLLFGLEDDKSLLTQYLEYWGNLFHGQLGLSFSKFPAPVSEVLMSALPWTLGLVGVATVISFIVGTSIGSLIGWRRGTWADSAIPATTLFSSVPYFWIGILAVAIFGLGLGWVPTSGAYNRGLVPAFTWQFISSVLYHAILPALTIVISSVAKWILDMRNMMVTVSSDDYITVAQAKGLSESRVMVRYAARNAILPQISGFALSLGFVVSGTLVMEMVFSYPGIGFNLYQAVGASDYPLMQGVFLVITLSVLVANLIADFAYVLFDPRTRQER
jgi:peptide/nickel transport system permease protein